MHRRQYARSLGGCVAVLSLAGCTEALPGGAGEPDYPGGTLVVENTGDSAVGVSVRTKRDQYDAALDTDVAAGSSVVRRSFVTAQPGDIVTLQARLGETGDRISFQFLPAGGEDDSPPEVARLTFENAVEANASWTATAGT